MSELIALRTPTIDAEFLVIYNRLCVALREQPDDSGVTQGIYFEALKDLPVTALEAGAAALMKEPARRFFPTTAEWRTAAEKSQLDQLRAAVKPAREEPWHVECDNCEDTGWSFHECDGTDLCGRKNRHAPHRYVKACPCRPMNRTYQRHQSFGFGS